jgi:hypothetical protein
MKRTCAEEQAQKPNSALGIDRIRMGAVVSGGAYLRKILSACCYCTYDSIRKEFGT